MDETKSAYSSMRATFEKYCTTHAKDPSLPGTISLFLIMLKEEKKFSFSYIESHLAAIADTVRFTRIKPHRALLVVETLKMIKKCSPSPAKGVPVEDDQLLAAFKVADFSSITDARDYFLIILAYKGMLRGKECRSIRQINFSFCVEPGHESLEVRLLHNGDEQKTKNTDPKTILIAGEKDLPKNQWKCVVSAFALYKTALADSGIGFEVSDFLFFNLTRKNLGKQLSKAHLNSALQRLLNKANKSHTSGHKSKGHDLRRKGATKALRNGMPSCPTPKKIRWLAQRRPRTLLLFQRRRHAQGISASLKIFNKDGNLKPLTQLKF